MLLEGNIGEDASLLANAADLAYLRARADQGGAPNLYAATAAVPANLTAPSSVVVAAALVTSKGFGIFDVSFDFFFTDSAADSVSVAVIATANATAVSGGSASGQWQVENGVTSVTVTGGTPVTVETLTKTVTTGALSSEINARFKLGTAPDGVFAISLVVTAAHNLSSMILNAWANELK